MAKKIRKWKDYSAPMPGVSASPSRVEGWLQIQADLDEKVYASDEAAAEAVSELVVAYLPQLELFVEPESRWLEHWKHGYQLLVPDPRRFRTYEAAMFDAVGQSFEALQDLPEAAIVAASAEFTQNRRPT